MRLRERLLVFLGVCLPVPVLAATGLSVPLPGTVERMAAVLVPFADSVTLADAPRQAQGAIVLTEAERQRVSVGSTPRLSPEAAPQHPEQSRVGIAGRRNPAVPATDDTDPGQPGSRPQPDAAPPPAPVPTAPGEHPPELGSDKPKGPRELQPRPQPPNSDYKPKPKPKAPKAPKEPKEPKAPKEPKPKPKPPPEPETSIGDDDATPEEDEGSRGGKPVKMAQPPSSAHGS